MERAKRLPVAYCKKILESSGKKYSDEEAEKIRNLLLKLGELDYRIYIEMTRIEDSSPSEQDKAA
jgi:hypothetical protein